MRTFNVLFAAACLLSAPFASAVECSGKVPRSALAPEAFQAGIVSPFGAEVRGVYALSNGQRVRLVDHSVGLVAVFDRQQLVRLEEAGANRFVSREGDVELSWRPSPQEDTIALRYPADSQGRLLRACEG